MIALEIKIFHIKERFGNGLNEKKVSKWACSCMRVHCTGFFPTIQRIWRQIFGLSMVPTSFESSTEIGHRVFEAYGISFTREHSS